MNNHFHHHRVGLTVFAIMALSLCLYPSTTNALTLTPTRFEINGNPGDTLREEMLLINEDDTPQSFYPTYANFEAQGESGSPAFVEPKDGLGTWMRAEFGSVYLAPHQQKIVPFTISIPKDAEPGGHFAVIFWGNSSGSGTGVSVGAKTGILVLLSVNGEVREEAGLLDFKIAGGKFFHSTLPVSFEYRFKNDGGDRIKPVGKITVRDTIFFPTEHLDANPGVGNILPASTRKFTVDWINYERPMDYVTPTNFVKKFGSDVYYQWRNFAVGLYSANLNVAYGLSGQHVKKTLFFFVFPWQLVLVLIVVFIIVFWGGKKLIRRYNKWIIKRAHGGVTGMGSGLPPESPNGL